jgi:hypothetical protein
LASDLNLTIGCTLRFPLVSLIYLPCACGPTLVGRRFISPEPPQMDNAAGPNSSLKAGHRSLAEPPESPYAPRPR